MHACNSSTSEMRVGVQGHLKPHKDGKATQGYIRLYLKNKQNASCKESELRQDTVCRSLASEHTPGVLSQHQPLCHNLLANAALSTQSWILCLYVLNCQASPKHEELYVLREKEWFNYGKQGL